MVGIWEEANSPDSPHSRVSGRAAQCPVWPPCPWQKQASYPGMARPPAGLPQTPWCSASERLCAWWSRRRMASLWGLVMTRSSHSHFRAEISCLLTSVWSAGVYDTHLLKYVWRLNNTELREETPTILTKTAFRTLVTSPSAF